MLTLFTPTRNRPQAFALLERYVERQTVPYHQWIVCCDSGIENYKFTMGQTVIHRTEQLPLHSICANYLACLDAAPTATKILFLEDDDWYSPNYFATYERWLDDADVVGIIHNRYYHVQNRAYCEMFNVLHSSLASTGITNVVLPLLREACFKGDPYIDLAIWSQWQQGKRTLYSDNSLHVGMKGLPGEPGCGLGHCLTKPVDHDGSILKTWLGIDAANYNISTINSVPTSSLP